MKKWRALWWVAMFLGVLGLQAFHRHNAHDGGLFAPHEDCSLCSHIGGTAGGDVLVSPQVATPLFPGEQSFFCKFEAVFSRPFLLPFGRAPPSSSVC